MREEIRELRELVAGGPEALVGLSLLPEEWHLFSKVEMVEGLGACLPSVEHAPAVFPVEAVEVTGRKLHWHFFGAKPRVRVKITFAECEGMIGGAALGWMLVGEAGS